MMARFVSTEQQKRKICGRWVVEKTVEENCLGKKKVFWDLVNPDTDEVEAGFENYQEAVAYAKSH